MDAMKNRIARTGICVALLVAATCVLVWFAFQFIPGEPHAPNVSAERYGGTIADTGNSRYTAESIVDIASGQPFVTQSVTRGKWFTASEDDRSSWSEDERERLLGYDNWLYDSDGIELTLNYTKAVTMEAFGLWYPHYAETTEGLEESLHESKILMIDVTMTNTADHAQRMPNLLIWSEDFNGANNTLDNGAGTTEYLLGELYGVPSDHGLVQYHIPESWFILEPGQTRSWTYPALVHKALFKDSAAYDTIDPSRFCIAIADYDPPTVYRLWLG